jgi:hypothetical protein
MTKEWVEAYWGRCSNVTSPKERSYLCSGFEGRVELIIIIQTDTVNAEQRWTLYIAPDRLSGSDQSHGSKLRSIH